MSESPASPGATTDPSSAGGAPGPAATAPDDYTVGWLEFALPLWHRRWRILLTGLVCAVLGLALLMTRPVRYTSHASFIVRSALNGAQGAAALSALPSLAGLMGAGSPTDLHLAILRSQAITERIATRFNLQAAWQLPLPSQATAKLRSQVTFSFGKRDGVVVVSVEDEHPVRAAAIANEYVNELRIRLRGFAREEAQQRRQFLESQVALARDGLNTSQKAMRETGFDTGALRSDAKATAEAFARLQLAINAAEVQLTAARRVRAEGSAEVQQLLSELSALRSQQARLEQPAAGAGGDIVDRARELRLAETLAENLLRQAQTARTDEASEPLPLQVLDEARPAEVPSSPQFIRWPLVGLLIGLVLQSQWVLLRHRRALASLDTARQQRLAFLRKVIAGR